jgi:hypothetical protein
VFGLLDQLKLELVAAPPSLLVGAGDAGLGFKTLVEDHQADRRESVLDSAEDASAGVVQVGKVILNREIQVKRGSRAQGVDEAQGVSALEHDLFKKPVIGEECNNRKLSNFCEIHVIPSSVAVNRERTRVLGG